MNGYDEVCAGTRACRTRWCTDMQVPPLDAFAEQERVPASTKALFNCVVPIAVVVDISVETGSSAQPIIAFAALKNIVIGAAQQLVDLV